MQFSSRQSSSLSPMETIPEDPNDVINAAVRPFLDLIDTLRSQGVQEVRTCSCTKKKKGLRFPPAPFLLFIPT